MIGFLTTHVLDTAKGCPAPGLKIELFRYKDVVARNLCEMVTNANGRTEIPILPRDTFDIGPY